MKQNLTEQVTRIKQMMGINEEDVNLDSYKEDTKIIKNVEYVGTSEEGNPIIDITVNSFIGQHGNPEGQKIEIKVTTEWKKTKKSFRHSFMINSIKNVVTNNENVKGSDILNNTHLSFIFMKFNTIDEVGKGLYEPYLKLHGNDKEYREKIYRNMSSDEKLIMDVLSSGESQNVEPTVDDTQIEEPKINDIKPSNSPWSSTSSW